MRLTWQVSNKKVALVVLVLYIWATVMEGLTMQWILETPFWMSMLVSGMLVLLSFSVAVLFAIVAFFFLRR